MRPNDPIITPVQQIWFPVLISTLVAGCLAPTGPLDPPLLQTDVTAYEWVSDDHGFGVEIPYTFTNRTGHPVFLLNCRGGFGLHLERAEEDGWQTAWSPLLLGCLSPAIVIQEREVWTDTLVVWGGFIDGDVGPRFDVADPTGTYRLVWDAAYWNYDADGPPWGKRLPSRFRMSNTFALTTE